MNQEKITTLLQGTKQIIKHQRELERLKGESFNVFSILKMERRENETHSAFLKELLDPNGSHLKGNLFLKLFVEVIGKDSVDVDAAHVVVEHYCGKRDDEKKKGGFIDIYIWDKQGKSISIENKIDAGDQNAQIERYVNYRKRNNTVFYLTLFGNEPTVESKGELRAEEDYFCISYKYHIQQWLKLCIKEAAKEPMLRESLKQYLIIIKKLTQSMDKAKDIKLSKLILKHSEEAKYIAANFQNIILNKAEEVRHEVFQRLQQQLREDFDVWEGNATNKTFSQIWLRPKATPDSSLFFGIESFNGRSNGFFKDGGLWCGILSDGGKSTDFEYVKGNKKHSNWWYNIYKMKGVHDNDEGIFLSDPNVALKLYENEGYQNELVDRIVIETMNYVEREKDSLITFVNNNQ